MIRIRLRLLRVGEVAMRPRNVPEGAAALTVLRAGQFSKDPQFLLSRDFPPAVAAYATPDSPKFPLPSQQLNTMRDYGVSCYVKINLSFSQSISPSPSLPTLFCSLSLSSGNETQDLVHIRQEVSAIPLSSSLSP